jgi:hypothetical protein
MVSPGVVVKPTETASIRAFGTFPTVTEGLSKFEPNGKDCVRRAPRPNVLVLAKASGTARSVTEISRVLRAPKSPRLQMAVRDARS